jgi:hypothetical protein
MFPAKLRRKYLPLGIPNFGDSAMGYAIKLEKQKTLQFKLHIKFAT